MVDGIPLNLKLNIRLSRKVTRNQFVFRASFTGPAKTICDQEKIYLECMYRHPEQSDKLLPSWRSCPGTAFIVQKSELVEKLRNAQCPKALIMGLPALYKIENYEYESFRSIREHICMLNPKGVELIEYSVICRGLTYNNDATNRTREELANSEC